MIRSLGCRMMCIALTILGISGCTTGVEPSPDAGIIRITLKSSETDTCIVIQNDTSRFSRWDHFELYATLGKVFRGTNYASIYATTSIERIPLDTADVLKRERLDGTPITATDAGPINTSNSRYRTYVIFNSYVAPGAYDRLEFSLVGYEIHIFEPKNYDNPVALPPGTLPTMSFPFPITVEAGRVTQIDIEIQPFRSLRRFQDTFLFDRKVNVVRVQTL